MIIINDKIGEHDLKAKLKNIKKWLVKGHTVNASIANQLKDPAKLVIIYPTFLWRPIFIF